MLRFGLTLILAILLARDEQRQLNNFIRAVNRTETQRYESFKWSLDQHKLTCRKCKRGHGLTCEQARDIHGIYYTASASCSP